MLIVPSSSDDLEILEVSERPIARNSATFGSKIGIGIAQCSFNARR